MTFLLTTWGFFLMGVWPRTNLWYLVMVIGCLFISSPSSSAREMINVPTFPTVASVYKVLSLKDIQCFKTLIHLIFSFQAVWGKTPTITLESCPPTCAWENGSKWELRGQLLGPSEEDFWGLWRVKLSHVIVTACLMCEASCQDEINAKMSNNNSGSCSDIF